MSTKSWTVLELEIGVYVCVGAPNREDWEAIDLKTDACRLSESFSIEETTVP
jgi:hypothetical protein